MKRSSSRTVMTKWSILIHERGTTEIIDRCSSLSQHGTKTIGRNSRDPTTRSAEMSTEFTCQVRNTFETVKKPAVDWTNLVQQRCRPNLPVSKECFRDRKETGRGLNKFIDNKPSIRESQGPTERECCRLAGQAPTDRAAVKRAGMSAVGINGRDW